jgi:hypothetical protein
MVKRELMAGTAYNTLETLCLHVNEARARTRKSNHELREMSPYYKLTGDELKRATDITHGTITGRFVHRTGPEIQDMPINPADRQAMRAAFGKRHVMDWDLAYTGELKKEGEK